jgi:hypothetical protein
MTKLEARKSFGLIYPIIGQGFKEFKVLAGEILVGIEKRSACGPLSPIALSSFPVV